MKLALRIPFKLSVGKGFKDSDLPLEETLDGKTWELSRSGEYYVLTVFGFDTHDHLHEFHNTALSALNWLMLKQKFAVIKSMEFRDIVWASDPDKTGDYFEDSFGLGDGTVDGIADFEYLTAVPEGKKIRFVRIPPPTIKLSTPGKKALDTIMQGAKVWASKLDWKLQTAFDLYAAHFSETSKRAKFLMLILTLEVLKLETEDRLQVIELVETWEAQVDARIEQISDDDGKDPDIRKSLESLKGKMRYLKFISLRRQLKALVLQSLNFLEHAKAEEYSREIGPIYDLRSKLVHGRHFLLDELDKKFETLRKIVPLVLEAFYKGFRIES